MSIGCAWPFQIVIRFLVKCIIPPNFRSQCNVISSHFLTSVTFLVQAYHGKFQSSGERAKIAEHGHFNCNLLPGNVHHPTKLQADIWDLENFTLTSFGTARQTDGQTDGQTDRQQVGLTAWRMEWRQYPSAPRVKMNKHLNFVVIFDIEMPHECQIICGGLQGLDFAAKSIPLLIKPCFSASPGHEQSWYWPSSPGMPRLQHQKGWLSYKTPLSVIL